MIHAIYQLLARIGYTHPLHPPLSHIPVGLTIGALVFGLVSLIFRRPALKLSAWHCALLAVVGVLPTALLGYMDWQERYGGAWMPAITIKIVLSGALFVLLLAALLLGRKVRDPDRPWKDPLSIGSLALYAVCFAIVMALGYFGATLVYGGASSSQTANPRGARQFTALCSSCHAGGGNSLKANFPLSKAPQLADVGAFVAYLRGPKARDGSVTQMPSFPQSRISDTDARDLHSYIVQFLKKE